ncbi:MAG: O-linked N-acetylglucosamine transferase, SPINDLY family protein [Casimicrobiaceae bacterium]
MGLTPNEKADRLIAEGHPIEDRGDFEGALALYRKAAEIAPGYVRAHMNVGNALQRLDRIDEAVAAQQRAVECAPDHPAARFNLGSLLRSRGDLEEADAELQEALRLQPEMLAATLVLADVYEAQQRFGDAEAAFRRALAIEPDHAGALLNFGMFCVRQGCLDEAMDWFKRAKARDPALKDVESFLLFPYSFRTDVDAVAIFDEHRRVGAAIQRAAGAPFTDWANAPDPDRPLRLAYVSGDFRHHPVALFLRPVLENHDPRHFETFCYSNYREANDVAEVLRTRCRHWTNVSHLDDRRFVELIRHDGIDILVELSGHTNGNRLAAFARHPAPVQVTWLGYLNTTGLPAMDYRICDPHTDPPGATEHLHTERLVRMPHSQWCYAPWIGIESLPIVRPALSHPIVFGSFNQHVKISDDCLQAWCGVLRRVSGSTLLVLDVRQPETRASLLARIERNGVDPARIRVRGREGMREYFAAIGSVDIALDTFPYNGATTTLDTLWMGVPVVALRGERGISRGSYSILKTLGADELIAYSADEYVDINVRLARDSAWRTQLHNTLRPQLAASPLMDAKQFVADLEDRYTDMWRAWCGRDVRLA